VKLEPKIVSVPIVNVEIRLSKCNLSACINDTAVYPVTSAISSTFYALTNVEINAYRSDKTNISCIDNMTLFTRTHKRCILQDFGLLLHCS
jgi:hypothetical protein